MANIDFITKLGNGIIGGIVGYLLALVLDSTTIFSMIPELPAIGLFLGIILVVLKDK